MFGTKPSVRETGRQSPDEHTYVQLSSGGASSTNTGAPSTKVPPVRQHGWDAEATWWYEDVAERCEEMQKKFPLCPPVFSMPYVRAAEWKRMMPGPEQWTMPTMAAEAEKAKKKEQESDPDRYHEGIQFNRCQSIANDNELRANHDCVRAMGCQLMVMGFLAFCIEEEYISFPHWRDRWRFFIITWIAVNIFLFAVGWMKVVQRLGDVLFIWLAKTNDHVTDSGMGIILEVRQLIISRVCGLLICEDEHFPRLLKHNGMGKICPGGFLPVMKKDDAEAGGDGAIKKDIVNESFEGRAMESQIVIASPECFIDSNLRFVCDDFDGVIRVKWCCDLETMSLETQLQDVDSNYYNLSESYYHQYYYNRSDADVEAEAEQKAAEAERERKKQEEESKSGVTKKRGLKAGKGKHARAKTKPPKPKGFESSSVEWRLFRPWLERDMDWVVDVSSVEMDELVRKNPWWQKLEFQLQLDQSKLGGFRDYLGSGMFNDRTRFKLVTFFTPMIACLLVYFVYFFVNDIRHPHVFRDTFQMFHHTGVFIGVGVMMNLVVCPYAQSAEVAKYVVNACMWVLERQVNKDWMVVFASQNHGLDAYVKAYQTLPRDDKGQRLEQKDVCTDENYVEYWVDRAHVQSVIDQVESIPILWQICSSTDNMKAIWKTVYSDICTNQSRRTQRMAWAEATNGIDYVNKLKRGATKWWDSTATSLQTNLGLAS